MEIHVKVHLHFHGDPPEKIDRVLHTLAHLERKVGTLMSLASDLQASMTRIEQATTENGETLKKVGANITQLAGRIKNNMTDAEVADLQSRFAAHADTLTAEGALLTEMAKDPTNPVPPVPPQLAAARAALNP